MTDFLLAHPFATFAVLWLGCITLIVGYCAAYDRLVIWWERRRWKAGK